MNLKKLFLAAILAGLLSFPSVAFASDAYPTLGGEDDTPPGMSAPSDPDEDDPGSGSSGGTVIGGSAATDDDEDDDVVAAAEPTTDTLSETGPGLAILLIPGIAGGMLFRKRRK